MSKTSTIFLIIVLFSACQQKTSIASDIFEIGVSAGTVKGSIIEEASGLVESINNPGLLWTHNDSDNDASIFLIDKTGSIKATVHLANMNNRDWEDITVGPGPEKGKNYVYIGEIGDNKGEYEFKYIFRIEEPTIAENIADTTITHVDEFKFQFSDGPRDSEALIIDPLTKDLYIFSKREEKINLYKLPYPQSDSTISTAKVVVANLPFTMIVAADLSSDGSEMLIKNYDAIYYWMRKNNETIEMTLKNPPTRLPYNPEPQGESIAFDRGGNGYYTLSEQKGILPQQLFFYKRKTQ